MLVGCFDEKVHLLDILIHDVDFFIHASDYFIQRLDKQIQVVDFLIHGLDIVIRLLPGVKTPGYFHAVPDGTLFLATAFSFFLLTALLQRNRLDFMV